MSSPGSVHAGQGGLEPVRAILEFSLSLPVVGLPDLEAHNTMQVMLSEMTSPLTSREAATAYFLLIVAMETMALCCS